MMGEFVPKIPPRYASVKIEDVPANVLETFLAIPQTKKGIYLHGDVGIGKTHILYALYKVAYDKLKMSPLFINTPDFFQSLRSDFDKDKGERANVGDSLLAWGLLFLDDLGVEKPTEWVVERFYSIVNFRYNEMKPTIYSSNFSIEELATRVGDRIASRIVETSTIIKLEGSDRRLKK